MELNNSLQAFLSLVRAGLWEQEVKLSQFNQIDFNQVYRLAEEQSVVGIVAAGIEHVIDVKVPQKTALTFVGAALQIEQRNLSMNDFIACLIEKLQNDEIHALLVKGQGIAQCYERPLWRAAGDVDLFLDYSSYYKAIALLKPMAASSIQERKYSKEQGFVIDNYLVELHGTLRSGLLTKLDKEIDAVQDEVFTNSNVRRWYNGDTDILLPGIDCDLFLLFTHFVRHFYHNELLIRQICDWCRFIWTYQNDINVDLLEKRLKKANLVNEWKSFAAFAIDYLGMKQNVIPLYDSSEKWHKKANMIMDFNMKRTLVKKVGLCSALFMIFPNNTIRFLPAILFNVNGLKIKERLLYMSKVRNMLGKCKIVSSVVKK